MFDWCYALEIRAVRWLRAGALRPGSDARVAFGTAATAAAVRDPVLVGVDRAATAFY